MKKADVIIIGSGVAALQLAKSLRDDLNVIIITKSILNNGNSNMAQGGVAAAIGKGDHPDRHVMDTLEAGRHHNDHEAVLAITKEAPRLIRELYKEGCSFDTDKKGELLLGMEGAHSAHRIVHGGGDATGKCIMEHLAASAAGRLEIIEHTYIFDLIIDSSSGKCIGVKGKNQDNSIVQLFAEHIVLAAGGCGQLYSHTSNAKTVTGDGIALAYKAGAQIADMEFIQFHPTLLYLNGKTRGLISEAVRGEGGRLVSESGKPIMGGVHPLGDLGPRHVVAQTIYNYLREGTEVYLDVSRIEDFSNRFPTITSICETNGVNWKQGIPVAPGSHFLMGGVKTDLIGRTSIAGLYAIGEVACTGLHGANRLASNSLLEGLFMGKSLSGWINKTGPCTTEIRQLEQVKKQAAPEMPEIAEIQRSMMNRVGIVRSETGLMKQKQWLERFYIEDLLTMDFEHFTWDEMTRVFMLITSWLITDSALRRTESRGGHYRSDFPCENNHEWLRKQIIQCRSESHESIETAVAT